MLTARQQLGERGEAIAARWLEARGWTVLARRFRSGHRDIDLVVARPTDAGRLVVFVEVRTRGKADRGRPVESVGWKKQRELARSARAWIASNRCSNDSYRFDVVGILLPRAGDPGVPDGPSGDLSGAEIEYVPDAFWVRWFG